MKTHRCWQQIIDPVNVWRGWRAFAQGKRRRPAVARFDVDAPSHVVCLAQELSQERYRPEPCRVLWIHQPKRRVVAAASVRDRVVHHALHRVLSPLLDRSFIDHSYACLPGRGTHRAILRFREGLRKHRYVIQLDLRHYFYSIDRGRLQALLDRKLPEPPLRRLLARILESSAGLYQRPEVLAFLGWEAAPPAGRGLSIGNLTSQWWANLYLDGLDHLATRRLKTQHYQRYMDDFAFFGDDSAALLAQRDQLADWLDRERGLRLRDPHARALRTDRDSGRLSDKLPDSWR